MNDKLERFRARVEAEQQQHAIDHYYYEGMVLPEAKIIPGRKYIKVDVDTSGKFMITTDGEIFGIKAYGVIHRGHFYGTLDTIDLYWWGDYAPIKKP